MRRVLFLALALMTPGFVSAGVPAAGDCLTVTSVLVSWYGPGFHGRPTSSGETFNMYELTAAHRTLPFGTPVAFTNPRNGRTVVVKVNDRGPYARDGSGNFIPHPFRTYDLSKAAARELDIIDDGVVALHAQRVCR